MSGNMYVGLHAVLCDADARTHHVDKSTTPNNTLHYTFDCAVVFVVLGDAGPLLLSPCNTCDACLAKWIQPAIWLREATGQCGHKQFHSLADTC